MAGIAVNGTVLAWARKERHLTQDDAARHIGITLAELQDIEDGNPRLPVPLLRKIAQSYRIAFASLLMPRPLPPVTRPSIADLRTFEGAPPIWSPKLQRAIESAWDHIDSLYDIRAAAPDMFVGAENIPKASVRQSPKLVAEQERSRFGISLETQLGCIKDRECFLRWRDAVEGQGVFVNVKNVGDRDNCRGFAIFDSRKIPYIFLNSNDGDYRERIFSLAHEYAHLLLRVDGVSDHGRSSRVERFCNDFAANFLMPSKPFLDEFNRIAADNVRPTEWHVEKLSARFHVSKSAAAIQMETLGIAEAGFYRDLLSQWRIRGKRTRSGGRASHVEKITNHLGGHFISVVLEANKRGMLNSTDVYEMTSAKPKYYKDLLREVTERAAAYGAG